MNNFYEQFIGDTLETIENKKIDIDDDKKYLFYTLTYKGVEDNEVILKDIVLHRFKDKDVPVVVINFESELAYGNFEDELIEQLLQRGMRVIFVKNSYYSNSEAAIKFAELGIAYWKINMASMQLCYQYLVEHNYMQDISFIAMNGLSASTLNVIAYNKIRCNHIFLINGVMDYNYVINAGLWRKIFPIGYYATADDDTNIIETYPELKYLNPYKSLINAQAEYKTYYDNQRYFLNEEIKINNYESLDEIFNSILELI